MAETIQILKPDNTWHEVYDGNASKIHFEIQGEANKIIRTTEDGAIWAIKYVGSDATQFFVDIQGEANKIIQILKPDNTWHEVYDGNASKIHFEIQGEANKIIRTTEDGAIWAIKYVGSDATQGFVGFVALVTPPQVVAGSIDKDGVKQFYSDDPAGQKYYLSDLSNPAHDPCLSYEITGSPIKNNDGSFDYWTVASHVGGLASGGTEDTCRIHISPPQSHGPQVDWHKAAQQGYMTSPKDQKNLEATAYIRQKGVEKKQKNFSFKCFGGVHTGKDDPRAGVLAPVVHWEGKATIEKELNHPDYDFHDDVPNLAHVPDMSEKWCGHKVCSWVLPDGKSRKMEFYIDTDPFDSSGKPKNNWVKALEWIDSGTNKYPQPVIWGGKYTTLRSNYCKTVDFRFCSARSIIRPQ